MHVCKCECEDVGKCCCVKHKSGFLCTRRKGHKGKHSAHGYEEHDVEVWEEN